MKQHVAHDQVAIRYADGIDRVWDAWATHAQRCERLFVASQWRAPLDEEDIVTSLRQAQYRAHLASEFAAGLIPPPSTMDTHGYLLGTLAACRDTLGVLATRAELGQLDADAAEIGLHAVDATCEAFRGAHSSTALVHAWIADEQVDPDWLHDEPHEERSRWVAVLAWMLVAACVSLLAALGVQLLVTGVPA